MAAGLPSVPDWRKQLPMKHFGPFTSLDYFFNTVDAIRQLRPPAPMTREVLIRRITTEFGADELAHLRVVAGSALCLHGGRAAVADPQVGMACDSLPVLSLIAERRRLPVQRSPANGSDRLGVGGWAEIFHDPELERTYLTGVSRCETVVDGIRADSLEATVAWYETEARRTGRDADRASLAAARRLTSNIQPTEIGR